MTDRKVPDGQKNEGIPDEAKLERAFEYYPRLRKVKEYVEEHLDEPITLGDVADIVALQPKYFSSWFKRKTGCTFSRWIQHLRISRAQELLDQKYQPIRRIAFLVGYKNLRTFQRAFKRETGVTPSEYRQ